MFLSESGLLESSAPRYTSYPTAGQFHDGVGGSQFDNWASDLRPGSRVDLYVHIPFCAQICWFCACRTQGASAGHLDSYLAALRSEIHRAAAILPRDVQVGDVTLGGGSPTVIGPDQIAALAREIRSAFGVKDTLSLTVEIDPRYLEDETLQALTAAGMSRAVLSVQDFDPIVQKAIGRQQSLDETSACIARLRSAGVKCICVDMLYGLPEQSRERMLATLDTVAALAPDRIALSGYAHVPWMAKRQRMISESCLPSAEARLDVFLAGAARLQASGYRGVGIDHFARDGDPLASAAAAGTLRRTFSGYSGDASDALIGFGASAISRFPQGFVQNALQTGTYVALVEEGRSAGKRGAALNLEDRIRGRAIEMLMCDFKIDLKALRLEFGDFVSVLDGGVRAARDRFGIFVECNSSVLTIRSGGQVLARLVARLFDAHSATSVRMGHAI